MLLNLAISLFNLFETSLYGRCLDLIIREFIFSLECWLPFPIWFLESSCLLRLLLWAAAKAKYPWSASTTASNRIYWHWGSFQISSLNHLAAKYRCNSCNSLNFGIKERSIRLPSRTGIFFIRYVGYKISLRLSLSIFDPSRL